MHLLIASPLYNSDAVASIAGMHQLVGSGFPDGFHQATETVKAGVGIPGVPGTAILHGQLGVGGDVVFLADDGA